jgi:hypothetical protein
MCCRDNHLKAFMYSACAVCLPQIISIVCHCVDVQQCTSPFLIVCPASVLL